ncbi:uncharacterized protein PV06_07932 [Exophiala oligosperma]|uniref:Cryptic loci regulator 2 N-terminal domain-containing protein n=1 Tax=Exophiala oligosperma TaxID=215243 RepID=A0A0D2DE64_9EURO|nr:uncharacterized protein PV06_07932 [Exophiala oligosperma]KIW40755.1 hypothetical protein PV06_07932 [Exophiala oligosperma]
MNPTASEPHMWQIIGKKGGPWIKVPIKPFTDGQSKTWPGEGSLQGRYRPSSEERHLIQLAKAWKKQQHDLAEGVNYYLDKLPEGYAVFELDQLTGNQVWKRLFGHPSGNYYDSIVRFQVHFLWLMSGKQGDCGCINCGKPQTRPAIGRKPRPTGFERLLPLRGSENNGYQSDNTSGSTSAGGSMTGRPSRRPQRQLKPAGAHYAVDEEGNEDVYKGYLKKLENSRDGKKGIEDDIRELNSFDWRAEHEEFAKDEKYGVELIKRHLTLISQQHSFAPRIGELVLWTPHFLDDHYLMLDSTRGEFKFYSFDQKQYHGFPRWRAGLVTQVPLTTATDGPVDFPDIQTLPDKSTSLNTSGFRIETFPDPNDEIDKTASKQYRYVPLRNVRPLSHWQMLLRGIPHSEWHPSIMSAMTCMTSISLYEKWWFKGEWPTASVLCKGIYIGPEFIMTGDTVRITPDAKAAGKVKRCTDVMIVDSIRLNLLNIRSEDVLPDTPLLSSASSITLVGRAYTLDIRRHYTMHNHDPNAAQTVLPAPVPQEEVKTVFRPVGTGDYGTWYYLHDPTKRYQISYDRVLGRLYEAAAVKLWTGQSQFKQRGREQLDIRPSLDFDLRAIEHGRKFASENDERIEEPKPGQLGWFWADTRVEALDIQTINGIEVGKYHDARTPQTLQQWRMYMKLINGHTDTPELFKFKSDFPSLSGLSGVGGRRGRKPGSKLVNGKVVMPGDPGYEEAAGKAFAEPNWTPRHGSSQLAGAALVSTDDEDDEGDEDENEHFEDAEEVLPSVEDRSLVSAMDRRSPLPQKKRTPVQSKAQIMQNPEDIDDDDDDDDDDDEWLHNHPPIRGGTEESEGGDYRPDFE